MRCKNTRISRKKENAHNVNDRFSIAVTPEDLELYVLTLIPSRHHSFTRCRLHSLNESTTDSQTEVSILFTRVIPQWQIKIYYTVNEPCSNF